MGGCGGVLMFSNDATVQVCRWVGWGGGEGEALVVMMAEVLWCGEFVCVRECACVVGREGCSSASMCAGGAVVMTPTTHLAISKPYFLPALNHQNRPSLLPAQTLKSYLP